MTVDVLYAIKLLRTFPRKLHFQHFNTVHNYYHWKSLRNIRVRWTCTESAGGSLVVDRSNLIPVTVHWSYLQDKGPFCMWFLIGEWGLRIFRFGSNKIDHIAHFWELRCGIGMQIRVFIFFNTDGNSSGATSNILRKVVQLYNGLKGLNHSSV